MADGCRHAKLSFGSGGFYVFCGECGAIWIPEGKFNDDNHQKCVSNNVLTDPIAEIRVPPNGPPVLSEKDMQRLERAVAKFDDARDLLAQAQQTVVLSAASLTQKLSEIRNVEKEEPCT